MTEAEILKKIYPSVVTFLGDWQKMIKDVSRFKLREISLFLTCANFTERKKIYQALENSTVKNIPHVHARHDMREEELDYLVKKFKTKAFTIHFQYFKHFENSKHKKKIFIETNNGQSRIRDFKTLGKVGGVCVDLSHLEHFHVLHKKYYKLSLKAADKYKVGCNHLSSILSNGRSWHYVKNVKELDYIKNIDKKYFSRYINIELGNSISEQLKFKKYIAKLLVKQWNKKS